MTNESHQDAQGWGTPGDRPGSLNAAEEIQQQRVTKRTPPAAATASAVHTWVDKTIDQAQRRGAFDNLPGAGKPLRDVDTRTDPDWWVKSLIEREQLDLSGAMPGVMQLRAEKATYPQSLYSITDEAAVRAVIVDFNERVLADRRRPHSGPGSPPIVGRIDVEEMLQAWRDGRTAG